MTSAFSRGATAESELPSYCEGILGSPFGSVQGNQAFSWVEGELGVLSTCGGNHGVPLEFRCGSGDTSLVATVESELLLS